MYLLLGVAVGSRDGLQAGSASVIVGQWPPWAHSFTWEIAFKAVGRLKSQFWFTEGELVPFSFSFSQEFLWQQLRAGVPADIRKVECGYESGR